MPERDDGDYPVGFGRPPRHTRFRPGRSGNPRGRPKGAKNVATALEQELNARVNITENGKRRRVAKRTVIAKHLVNSAAQGDLKATALLLQQFRPVAKESAGPLTDEPLSREEDRLVMESITQRILRAVQNGAPPAPEQSDASPRDDDAETT
jgi:hypothetical protein